MTGNPIGVAACTWGLEPGYDWVPAYDPQAVITAAAALGFNGFEPATGNGPGATVAELAAGVGLSCPARFVGLRLGDSDAARRASRAALDDLLDLGGQVLMIGVEEPGDERPVADLADACAAAGVTAAIHPELGAPVATGRSVDELLERSAALSVCLDTGHFWAAGDHDLTELVRRWGDRIAHVHLKDVSSAVASKVDGGLPVREAVQAGLWQPLGAGEVPLTEVLEALAASGYAGWLVVEDDFAPRPERSAAESLRWLRAVLA